MPDSVIEWDVPQPLTAAAVERQLADVARSRLIRIGGAGRSGPGADARLLGLLAGDRAHGVPEHVHAAYKLAATGATSNGWDVILRSPTMHLLARHASSLVDYDGADVRARVLDEQSSHTGMAGVITTTGGQAAILDMNAALAARHSRTLFAVGDPEILQRQLNSLVTRRGAKPTFNPRLVTYLAEAMENVREHGLVSADGSLAGLCLLQIKRMNPNQIPGIEKQLPAASAFLAYVKGVRTKYGKRLLGLLETTVADSGVGIAATLTGSPDIYRGDPDAERRVLLSAFEPNVSRKPTAGSGGGLTTMLENLHAEDGAIQVRCGRISLFRTSVMPDGGRRSWSIASGAIASRVPDPVLWDIGLLPFVTGTGITLVTPILR